MSDDADYECWFINQVWDGLSYLLVANRAPMDVVHGGTPISDFEWTNDGPARYHDPAAMRATGVRHGVPREEDARGEDAKRVGERERENLRWLELALEGLAGFFARAASANDATIMILG